MYWALHLCRNGDKLWPQSKTLQYQGAINRLDIKADIRMYWGARGRNVRLFYFLDEITRQDIDYLNSAINAVGVKMKWTRRKWWQFFFFFCLDLLLHLFPPKWGGRFSPASSSQFLVVIKTIILPSLLPSTFVFAVLFPTSSSLLFK